MTDKDFLFKLAFAELAYATNLRSVAKEKLEKAAILWTVRKRTCKRPCTPMKL